MKKEDLIYMAGMFDGEGCIHIAKPSGGNFYILHCALNMANRYIPDLFKSHFSGSIFVMEPLSCEGRKKRQWKWQISACLSKAFLETILPYLRLKKAEAELGIAFQGEMQYVGHRLTSEERARKEAQYWQMRELKKGGTNDEKTNTV